MYKYPSNEVRCPKCYEDTYRPKRVRMMFTGNCARTKLDKKRVEMLCPECEWRTHKSIASLVAEYEKEYGPIPEQLKLPEVPV